MLASAMLLLWRLATSSPSALPPSWVSQLKERFPQLEHALSQSPEQWTKLSATLDQAIEAAAARWAERGEDPEAPLEEPAQLD